MASGDQVIEKLRAAFRELVTIDDNTTHDLARWLALLSVVVYWALTVYDVVRGNPWRMQECGIGLAAVFAAAGAWIFMEKRG